MRQAGALAAAGILGGTLGVVAMPALPASAANCTYTSTLTASGARAIYPLNDASGSSAADVSGNANTATITTTGATYNNRPGPLTCDTSLGALGFDGTNTHALMPSGVSSATTGTGFTAMAWFKATNFSTGNPRILANAHTDSDGTGFQMAISNGGGGGFFDIGTANNSNANASWSQSLVAGKWYLYAGTYDGTTVRAYINGTQVGTAAATGAIKAGGTNVSIGYDAAYSGDPFNGQIADVAIVPSALSATTIANLYTGPVGTNATATWTNSCSTWTSVTAPAGTVSGTFSITGGGGAGGDASNGAGGNGGRGAIVSGTAPFSAGDVVWLKTGCGGVSDGNGGDGYTSGGDAMSGSVFNGAGAMTVSPYGGGGGGSTALCVGTATASCGGGSVLAIAAGGGGGASGAPCSGTSHAGGAGGNAAGGSASTGGSSGENLGNGLGGGAGNDGTGGENPRGGSGGGGVGAAGTGGSAAANSTGGVAGSANTAPWVASAGANGPSAGVAPSVTPGATGIGGNGGGSGNSASGGGGGGLTGGGGGGPSSGGTTSACNHWDGGGGGGGGGSWVSQRVATSVSSPTFATASSTNSGCVSASFTSGTAGFGAGSGGGDGCGGYATITFTVLPTAVSFTSQPASAFTNAIFGPQPVVNVANAGNAVIGDPVALSIKPGTGTGGATLSCTSTTINTDSSGNATFAGCKINTAGTGYVLRATVDGTTYDSNPFDVTAGISASVDEFTPATEVLALQNNATQSANSGHIRVMAVVRHNPGVTVDGVRFDLVHNTSGGTYAGTNCSTTATIDCSGGYVGNGGWNNQGGRATNTGLSVRELPTAASPTTPQTDPTYSNYSQVWVDITPPNFDSWQNDGPDGTNVCGLETGTSPARICLDAAAFSFHLSDGGTTGDKSFNYRTIARGTNGTNEDYPTNYSTGSTTDQVKVNPNTANAITVNSQCDDADSSSTSGVCDWANYRFRRLGDNTIINLVCSSAGSASCFQNSGQATTTFDQNDTTARSFTYASPSQSGLWVIEGEFCNEQPANLCPAAPPASGVASPYGSGSNFTYTDAAGNTQTVAGGNDWQEMGSFYVNAAAPTASFGTTTQTGGGSVGTNPATGSLHPNSGTTITYNATVPSDAQVVDWNLNQNNTDGIAGSGYELRKYGTVGATGAVSLASDVTAQTLDTSALGQNANCGAGFRVYDQGGFNATDPAAASATATKACTTNNVPVGTAQTGINVQRGQSTAINLAATDADRWSAGGGGGDEAPTIAVTQPAIGTVTCGAFATASNTTGTFACSYAVPANATPGAYSYSYTVTDSHAGTSSSVTVTGSIQNTAPTASGASHSIQRGTSGTFNLTATDPANGDTLDGTVPGSGFATVSTASMPAGSTTDCTAAGACTVDIAAGTAPGSYSFTWKVQDNANPSATATETVTVTNTAPVANTVTVNDVQRGRPDSEAPFNLSATDANGDTLTYSIVDQTGLPAGTTLTCSGAGACTVAVPADTADGNYSFTYKANDNAADSNTSTATIGVSNTTPVANNVGPLHTTVGNNLAVTLDGTDFNGDTLTYAAPVTAPTKGNLTGSGAARTYVASNGTKGADTFTYTTSDNAPSTSTEGTVSIIIDNTAPVADGLTTSAPRQITTNFSLSGSDVNGDAITYAVDGTTTKGSLTCSTAGDCAYTAGVGESGDDAFTFVTNDGTANSADATVTIHITNNAPVAAAQTVDAPRRVPTGITLSAADANGDPLTYSAPITGPSKGSVDCTGTNCTYTSDPGQTGTDSFTFGVDDGFGGTDTATVSINLTNLAPTADPQSVTTDVHVVTPILLTGSDGNQDTLTFSVTDQPTKGDVTCDTAGSCSYQSHTGVTGTDSFTFKVDDGHGGTDSAVVSIGLSNTNPVAQTQSIDAQRTIATPITLAGSDPNDDPLTYTAPVTGPSKGTLNCTDADCTYTSSPGETGTDAFTFTVDDGNGGTDTATVNINLTNTDPTADPASYTVTKATPKAFTLTGGDANGDAITFEVLTPPTLGTLSCTGANCTYTATSATGADSFTYVTHDAFGGTSDPTTVSLNISLPKIGLGDVAGLEPDSGMMGVYVPVTLSAPLATDVTVSYYTQDITAHGSPTGAPGADYQSWGSPATPRTIKIPAGQTWVAVSAPILADGSSEPDETFKVVVASITAADGSVVTARDGTGTVTIVDSAANTSLPIMYVEGQNVYEGDAANGTNKGDFVIMFSRPVSTSFTLSYQSSNGTATGGKKGVAGADYNPVSGTYTVPAGVLVARTIDIAIWGDTQSEADETLGLQVIVPDGAPVVQRNSSATMTIVNDD